MSAPRARPAHRRARAFALPLAVLLSVAATLMAAVMLDRVAAQTLTVQRTLEHYRTTHQSRGLREIVDFWIKSAGRRISESLDPDGRALDLQLADGSVVSLFVTDGQGAMLADFSALREEDRQTAALMLAQLRTLPDPPPDSERTYGPVPISANSAAPEVLQAAAVAIAGPDLGAAFATAVLEARAQKTVTSQDLTEACIKAQIEGEPRGRLLRAITAEPSMWKIIADVRGAPAGPLLGRAEMSAVVPANRGRSFSPFQRTSILNFRWVPLQDVTPR